MAATLEDLEQIERNMTNHPPADAGVVERMEALRAEFKATAGAVVEFAPPSRERSLAQTNLEQALMWSIAAIARNQDD